jgi:hypothetical chaperone protein
LNPIPAAQAIGIDFGTTNSSVARATPAGVDLVRFPFAEGFTDAYRSLLYLEKQRWWTGPAAIEEYLAAETKGRLVQSLKSFLTSRSLKSTNVFGRQVRLEELIARILRDLREKAEAYFDTKIRTAVAGRPVRFVGAESDEDNAFAEERLTAAFRIAGFESVSFVPEPVAAAYYYESTLDHDELILIGDFGGGTSDFSLLRAGPGVRMRGRTAADLLGNSGVGIAGDVFDARIVRHLVSPALGRGSLARSFDKLLPAVPNWVYTKLEYWHHLSLLRTASTINMLTSSRAEALEPAKIAALLHLIREDLGYDLHRAVQKLKRDLSAGSVAEFRFADGDIDIEATVERRAFEGWIAADLARIEACLDSLIAASGADRRAIDMVFLTGGSSLVPAVRAIFETRFGAAKIRTGNEFTSVARGLALCAPGKFHGSS